MPEGQLPAPIALFIFNRPDTTARVFAAIRAARPQRLLIVADGPRSDRPGEAERCAAARAAAEQIDWPCEVTRNYADANLGCRRRLSSGLDWVFESVAEAIILEDDCLPEATFFPFCAELLERYRNDERVMHISGDNFQTGRARTAFSYYFSRFPHVWGWASWRRAWRHYDVNLARWPELRAGGWLRDWLGDARAARQWTQLFDRTHRREIDTWDFQWTLACWAQSGLSILPAVNLVSNIGFNAEATHTRAGNRLANLPTQPLAFPLRHPTFVIRDAQADAFTQRDQFTWPGRWRRLLGALTGSAG